MFKNVRGTKDFLPAEQALRNKIRKVLEETFERYGFMPLETAMLCEFDLLASKYAGGAEILKEVYTLNDRGERTLGLRYDLTVPFAKVVGMSKDIRLPFKRYEIGKVFRDGPVKKGRLREFTQCDVDVVGSSSMMSEVEYMAMTFEVFEALDLEVYIAYNNRKLLYGILKSVGIQEAYINDCILSLDKLAKIGTEGVKQTLIEKGVEGDKIDKLVTIYEYNDADRFEYFNTKVVDEKGLEGLKEIDEFRAFAKVLGIEGGLSFDPFLARGLDIYTGTVFEIFMKDGSVTSSVGAGGRYDKIIGGFIDDGQVYPAVGISFGLDVIFTVLKEKNRAITGSLLDLLVISMGEDLYALKVADYFRKSGKKVDIDISGRKVSKLMSRADKEGIKEVVVVGDNEANSKRVTVKHMVTGEKIEMEIE